MKISPINRLKLVKKQLKNRRLITILAVVAVLLVGTMSVAVYAMSLQKKKVQVAEKIQEPAKPAPKEEQKASVVAEEKVATPVPTNAQPTPAPKSVAAPTKPVADRSKPITAQIGWWGGPHLYTDQDVHAVSFEFTAVRIIGFIGGELHWQAEVDIDGAISVINSGSATIAPKQGTYDIPRFNNREILQASHSGNMLFRMHITSPNDTATDWRPLTSDAP